MPQKMHITTLHFIKEHYHDSVVALYLKFWVTLHIGFTSDDCR